MKAGEAGQRAHIADPGPSQVEHLQVGQLSKWTHVPGQCLANIQRLQAGELCQSGQRSELWSHKRDGMQVWKLREHGGMDIRNVTAIGQWNLKSMHLMRLGNNAVFEQP